MTNKSKSASPVPSPADPDLRSVAPALTEGDGEVSAKIEAVDETTDLEAGAVARTEDGRDVVDAAVDASATDGTSIPIDPALSGVPVTA